MKQLRWQTNTSFLNFRPKLDDCTRLKYSLDTASASMNIMHLLCYVAGVRTAAFVTVMLKFLCLFFSCFPFVAPKDVSKTASVDKRYNVYMLEKACMVQGCAHGWLNHFESGGHNCTSKNYGKFLWFELKTVTSQSLKMTSLNFVSMFKQCFISPQLYLRYTDLST